MEDEEIEVVEAEVLDEHGRPIAEIGVPSGYDKSSRDHARPKGDTSGVLGGFLVLAVGFLATLGVILFTLFVAVPLALLGRLFGRRREK